MGRESLSRRGTVPETKNAVAAGTRSQGGWVLKIKTHKSLELMETTPCSLPTPPKTCVMGTNWREVHREGDSEPRKLKNVGDILYRKVTGEQGVHS